MLFFKNSEICIFNNSADEHALQVKVRMDTGRPLKIM